VKSEYDMPKLSLRQIYLDALGKRSPEARAAYLEEVCGSDDELKSKVEALLREAVDDGFLEIPAAHLQITEALPLPESPGSVIGRYKLLQKLGEGGCGAVYMAEQTEPVRRRVALKVIKLGMDTKAVIARFEAERQALALMDHPNIAKVLDAGSTDSGRPYFVMELVRGIRITDYCDQNKLDTKQRLELFIQICQAIQHAHQKGIIHRDIKPSNILVTLHDGIPVPKVIDFGIAKATTDQRLTDKTLFTAYEQFIGTPAYMSPEQAEMSGLDIDTRSDIYSLGVLLYELLTGRTPFDGRELMSLGIDAMRKTIREQEPPRPSMKLHTLQGAESTTTAQSHGAEMPRLIHLLRGDLDWIVMKCLEKDRVRRYDTANGLAMDIQRHLTNEPVVARPPSKLYEFQKTVRRHKVGFAATAAVVAALAVGVVASTSQAVRAKRAERTALAAQTQADLERQKAQDNEKHALELQASETRLRQAAETQELSARRRAYASDMNVAKQALDGDNLGLALELLDRQRPQTGETDLRGWEWRYLWQQTRSDALYPLCKQPAEVTALAVSSDGNWLAVGANYDVGLSLWNLRTREKTISLVTNASMIRAAFSPDGTLLAFSGTTVTPSGGSQDTLYLWDMTTQQMRPEVPLDGICQGLAFSDDGRILAISLTSLQDYSTAVGQTVLWSVPDGTNMASYESARRNSLIAATSFAASPDLSRVAYDVAQTNVCVQDLREDGKVLWTKPASEEYIVALAFSPDGKILASAAGFGTNDIRLWDADTGQELGPPFKGHGSFVCSMVFWPDGRKLASSSGDQTIRIWDVTTGACLDVLRGHQLEVYRVALLPDGKLVSGSKDGEVCVWETSKPHRHQERYQLDGPFKTWHFEQDSRSVLTVQKGGRVERWWGTEFEQHESVLDLKTGPDATPLFLSDGRLLATDTTNGVIEVWDVLTRTLRYQLTNTTDFAPLRFYQGGNRLLLRGSNSITAWDLPNERQTYSWRQPAIWDSPGYPTAISPDDTELLSVGGFGDTLCVRLDDGVEKDVDLNIFEAGGVAYSPDGRYLAASSYLGFARVWDTSDWSEIKDLRGYLVAVDSVAFSPDGSRLATGSDREQAVRLWDTDSWQDVLTLEGTKSHFEQTAFSPDGSTLGSINGSGTLHLWRAPSKEEIEADEAEDPPSPGYGATITTDGQQP